MPVSGNIPSLNLDPHIELCAQGYQRCDDTVVLVAASSFRTLRLVNRFDRRRRRRCRRRVKAPRKSVGDLLFVFFFSSAFSPQQLLQISLAFGFLLVQGQTRQRAKMGAVRYGRIWL